ncbi:hypothetical protein H8356DRAFT_996875 [Neocallimastix lanati (nom. inval.)]|nr:hypothetical protein H8356DRAFT_996875 [Neocallimastix sp. JGI-2020a]
MLGWKYFCLIYLLLLYQLQYVLAVNALAACSITNIDDSSCTDTLTNDTNTYCLSNKFIYRVTTDGKCVSKITSGVHIFDEDQKEVDLTITGKITDTDIKKYSMYACSESGCTPTTGYIKINEVYILLLTEPEDWKTNMGAENCKYYYVVGNSWTNSSAKTTPFTEDYFYSKSNNAIYLIGNSDIQYISAGVSCTSDKEGAIYKSYETDESKLCLGVNPSGSSVSFAFASGNDEEYILTNPSSDSIFSISTGSEGIILKRTPNVIYHDNSQSDKATKIIDTETKKKATSLTNSDLNKYYIYECEGGYCNKKTGHNIINVNTMERIEFTSNIDEDIKKLAILNCDSNSCKRTFGYFKTNDGRYYSVPYTGFEHNDKYQLITDCDENIGGLMMGEKFCQDFNEIDNAMTIGQSYIISANSQTIFSDKIEGKSLVISATSNTLIYNGLSANEGIQLFGSGVLISTTESDITNKNENKLVLYYCNNNGICHSLKGYIKDNEDNYYKVEDNKSKKISVDDSNYEFKECSKETAGNLISDKKLCLGNESVDFINVDNKTEYYIYNRDDQYLFVRGVKNMFTIEKFNGSVNLEKFNVINTEDVTRIDIEKINASDLTNIITNLTLFNCDVEKGICRQTYGYIKSKDNTYYYSFDANKSNPNKVIDFTSSKCSDSSDIGTLQTEGKLCLIEDSNNPKKESMTDGNNYVISVSANNIFSGIEENIVIRATNYAFYYDNLYDVSDGKNVVLTDADTKITEITENTDVTKLKVYLCNTSGKCTQVDAFIEKGDKYYQIINSNASEITESLLDTCTINNLLKGGKLCTNGSNNDAINFIKDDTISYYMTYDGTNYKLVIAKSNLFIVASINGNGGSFNLINLNNAEITDLSSSSIKSDDIPYLALFSCQTNNKICKRTYGYVKDMSNKYYEIHSSGVNGKVESVTSCIETDVGKLDISSGNLCLKDSNSIGTLAAESYVMSNSSGSVFSQEKDINIYISSTANAFYHDKFVDVSTDGGVKLFQSNKLISLTSISDAEKLSLYICNSEGICIQADGYAKDSNNSYYTIETLYSSILNTDSTTDSCSSTEDIGKLIKSTYNLCTSTTDNIAFPEQQPDDGLNIYIIKNPISKFKSFDKKIETETLTNLYFFNCDLNDNAKKCKQTYGYLKGADTIYEINVKGTKSIVISNSGATGTIGSITTETVEDITLYKFCINETPYTVDFVNNGKYIINTVDNNIFTGINDKPIVTNSTSNVIFYDNLYRGSKVILTASNVAIEVKDITENAKENSSNLKVYSCDMTGSCKQENGYVTDGNSYYSVSKDNVSSKIEDFKNSCEENIGKLNLEKKLCINGNNNEAVEFLTESENKNNYIIIDSNKYNIVTSIQNMFLISGFTQPKQGTNIVNIETSENIDPTNYVIEETDLKNIALFYCININGGLSCKRTIGCIKIQKEGINPKYYSIGYEGDNSEITPNSECKGSSTGQLDPSENLCLYANSSLIFTGELPTSTESKSFIIKRPNPNPNSNSSSVFANTSNENILIYSDANSFVFENIVDISSDKGIKLFLSNNLVKDISSVDIATENVDKLSLYICSSEGICTRAEGFAKDKTNYYNIFDSEESSFSGILGTNNIESCSLANIGNLVDSNKSLCIGDADSIEFPASESIVNNYVIHEDEQYKFVKTYKNVIAKIKLKDYENLNDFNLIDCENAKVINTSDGDYLKASFLTSNIGNLALFRCDIINKICKQTYGYLASNDSTKSYYSFDAVSKSNNLIKFDGSTGCNGDTDVGTLQSNGELCLKSDSSNQNQIKYIMNEINIYNLSIDNPSVFSNSNSGKSVIIRSNGWAFYLDNYYSEKGVNLFVSYRKSETSDVSANIRNTLLCNCQKNGICTAVEGYVKYDNTYYKIASNNQYYDNENLSEANNFETACSNSNTNGWKVLSYGKLCLGSESIQFLMTEQIGFYIGFVNGVSKFIRAIENVFTIEDLNGNINDGANLVNVETATILITPVITDVTPILKNLLYFNCDTTNSICKQTVGYLKTSDATASSGYYAIYSSSDSNVEVGSFSTSCNIEENGMLTNDGKLCSEKVSIELSTSVSNYIISKPNDSTPFKSNNGDIIMVSATNTNIILNNLYGNAGPNLIYKSSMTKYDLTNIESNIQKLLLFNCGRNGICLSNIGYITDGNKYFEIKNKIDDNPSTPNKNKECTFSENIGEINKGHELVLDKNESIPFLTNNEKADYIIKEGTLLVRAIPGIFSIGSITNPLNENRLYGVIRDSATAFKLPTLSNEIEEGLSSLALYDCDENKICKQTYGYLKSTDNNPGYYSLGADGTTTRIVPESSCSNKVGNLIKDDKFCLTDDGSVIGDMSTNLFIINATTNSVFSKSTTETDLFVMIKATSSSLILKTMENGYQVRKKEGNIIIAPTIDDLNQNPTKIGIYGCERKMSTCKLVPGYVISGTKYYISKANEIGVTEYGDVTEVNSTKSNYCKEKIGHIVKESSTYYLCLGDEISVELSQDNDGNYIAFEAVATGSPLEAKKMIKYSTENSVGYIVNDEYFEGKDRNYVIKVPNSNISSQENYYLYLFENGSYSLNNERVIGVYKQLNEGNTYEDISSELSYDDNIYIFFCESGKCIETLGYMNIDGLMYTNDNTSREWEIREKTNNCSPLEYNYVSYDGSQLKVCMKIDNGNSYSVVDQSKDYMIAIRSTNSYQKFIGNSGSSIIGKPDEKDGYYLIKENIIITDTSDESNIIVICQNSECTILKAEDGYYPDANGNAVIHCISEGENITCKLEKVNKSSTFIDAGDTSHLIYCEVDTDSKVYCSSFESNASEEKQEHYVSGDEKLITCTFNGEKPECVIEGSTFNGYFMDSAPQQSTDKKIIRCAYSICEEIKISELNLTGPGNLKNDADGISIEINESTSIKVEIGCETSYQSIDVEANVFPGVHEKSTISIKIDKDGSIIYLEDTSLETCESTCTNEIYCWDSQNSKIQTEVNQVCDNIDGKNHIELTEAGKAILFYNNNGKNIEEPTLDTTNIMAYQCTFVEGENLPQEKCILVKGYLISKDNKIRQCNGWKREGCTIVENSGPCVDGDEGRLGEGDNSKEVCFGKNLGVPLPTKEDEVRYVAFQVNNVKNNNVNEIYGKNKGEIVFLALTKNSVLVAEESEAINEGIYLNWNAENLNDGLIDCTVKGSIEECIIKSGLGYYLDANSLFKKAEIQRKRSNENDSYNWLIKCEKGTKCQLISPNKGYYINADVSNELPKALIRCPDETYCIAYDGNPNDIYINNDDSKLIQCNSDKCLSVNENTNMLGNNNIPTYFKNADEAADDSSILIKCSGTCTTISAESNSVFLNGNLKLDAINENGESGKPLIICYNKSYSGTDASSIECKTSEAEGAESYYINAGDYISNDNKKLPLIKCESNSECESKEANIANEASEVFYINSNYGEEKDNENYLIKCTSDTECEYYNNVKADDNSEYYVHGEANGIENAVIECTMEEINEEEERKYKVSCRLIENQLPTNVYISTYNQKQIIICSSNECTAQDNGSTPKKTEYYINTDPENNINSLIKCSYNDNCITVEDFNEFENENQVFINSDFGKADDENQLIKCEDGSCELTKSGATSEKPEYYFNSGDSDTSGDYRGDVIECIANEDSKVTCDSIISSEGSVYINANYDNDKNENQLIICENKVCKEKLIEYTDEKTEYTFVNAGKENEGGIIKCYKTINEGKCSVSKLGEEDTFIDNNTGQLIVCDESGCKPKSTGASTDSNEYYLSGEEIIKCEVIDGEKICKKVVPIPTNDDGVFIDSSNPNQIIYCDGNKCYSKPSTADDDKPQYFINGDPDSDMIECRKNGEKITCKAISGNDGDVFLNGSYPEPDQNNQIIKCNSETCIATTIFRGSGDSDENPQYFVNSGNKNSNKMKDALIVCVMSVCELQNGSINDVYVNSDEETKNDKPLIKCEKLGCSIGSSGATKGNNEIYINAGKDEGTSSDNTSSKKGIIECSIDSSNKKVTCIVKKSDDVQEGLYLNSNYSENGDTNQMIKCTKKDGCTGMTITEGTDTEYHVNGESTGLENAIIACTNTKCEKQTPTSVPSYYVGKDENGNQGLIECVETTISNRRRSTGSNIQKCTWRPAFISEGYYLNNGYNKLSYPLIQCDSSEGCNPVEAEIGYYVNAGNSQKPVIVCERENNECYERESPICPEPAMAIPGNYCFADGQLKFFKSNGSTAVYASKNKDIFVSVTIPKNGFPGIRSSTFALFKVSYYSINRYYKSGSIIVDKNGNVVDSMDGDQSGYTIYTCDEITKVCTESKGCSPNTYLYDAINKKAIRCNEEGIMEYTDEDGYVIDGSGGSKTSIIIYCDKDGENCYIINPNQSNGNSRDSRDNSGSNNRPKTVYYTNGNNLIKCTNGICVKVSIKPGNYIGYGEDGKLGIIHCNANNECIFINPDSGVKYLNSGSDRNFYPLIECTLNDGCYVSKGNPGYYLTSSRKTLIFCKSFITCYEINPIEHYYFNADCTEENNTIIKCVEAGNVISCFLEDALSGYYLTSEPDKLVHCRIGNRCKEIRVYNGIFRGALKKEVSIKKRSEMEKDLQLEIMNSLNKKLSKRKNESLEVNDNSKNIMDTIKNKELKEEEDKIFSVRDINDVYGIIRCVEGKCATLTINELSAVPICEFSNNKCYITLDYSMTKKATTSIGAGDFCTNSDHSVLYFATDTIVVKPNVISGKTATYVYTTSTTNCLEANDSYHDRYFAEKSTIYSLDVDCILQIYETAYIFLNNKENRIVRSRDIDEYNDNHVKLYSCKESNCRPVDALNTVTYIADINKRILKYNVNNKLYSFANDKDIICIFKDNKCTPNVDMKKNEFCVTYKGELVLAQSSIKNRETGDCYLSEGINSYIYGYGFSQHLYHMNQFSAQMVDQTGYYIINMFTNTIIERRIYFSKNINLVMYACIHSSCHIYEPHENTYYYDSQAKTIFRYRDGKYSLPNTSGYAYISIDPTKKYIYKFEKAAVDEIKIQTIASYGYYYTIDKEMYYCSQDKDSNCSPISETGYYITNTGTIYYCIHDSEELEETECTKQNCISGQYYYIEESYYRCDSHSNFVPMKSKYCSYDENVIINFPLALTEELPFNVKQAIENIRINNNSTAISHGRGKNNLESVSGIFTNCTYNIEESISMFDLVCINNYVVVDKETDELKICSIEQLGYVECIENEENPKKCNISSNSKLIKPYFLMLICSILTSIIFIKIY